MYPPWPRGQVRVRQVTHQIALVLALAPVWHEFVSDLTAMLHALVLGQVQVTRALLAAAWLTLSLPSQSRRWRVGSCCLKVSQALAR